MGRRNINTTKSGKYMNPTDQARKEARKRELKKNKKQRQMVRTAVLKGKDPTHILVELEKMDMLEFSVEGQATLSEKVVSEKRKKLKETLDRVMKLYEKENPEYWVELRRMESEYEKKRMARMEYYEAVRHAQAVTVDEIPLPNLDMPLPPDASGQETPTMPNIHMLPPQSILKKLIPPPVADLREGPGCPPFPPPELSDDDEEEEAITAKKTRTIRFADSDDGEEKDTRVTVKKAKSLSAVQRTLLQISGQDIDEFMRESEVLFQEKEAEKQADLKARLGKLSNETNLQQPPPAMSQERTLASTDDVAAPGTSSSKPKDEVTKSGSLAPPGVAPSGSMPAVPPPMIMRPPPRPNIPMPPGVRMPPIPPPQGMFKRLPNTRMPPPMPMRPPNRPMGLMPPGLGMSAPPPGHNPNVLTAGPQLITRPKDDEKTGATIEAKAQIRNLSAAVTRFLPTALRVKREDKKKSSKYTLDPKQVPTVRPENRRPTKDDAYSQFMREMEDLL